jgi:two-component system, chemotaxis family, protein-glutamate methylesterase/glutaminase
VIKILVVDDSALMRKLLGKIFAAASDFDVRFARNGADALDQLGGGYRPNVITMDVQMPQMDGLTCLDRIMIEHPCPVVMVSSLTAAGAEATLEALRLGAVDFVAKPDGAISLSIDRMAAVLVQKVRAAAAAKPRSSLRLKERVRHRMLQTGAASRARRDTGSNSARAAPQVAVGDGLVLVGTSTGGPPALEAVIGELAANFPWPILVAQHLPASFTGPLARRLDGVSAVSVVEVVEPTALRPGCVYIGRGDADIIVGRRTSGLVAMTAPPLAGYLWHPSTDRLVRTAMQHMPAERLIGVLMTGMGNDGAAAMTELYHCGGRTIAEAEDTAIVWGMPGELVKGGGAAFVELLPDIAGRLQQMVA